MLDQGVHPPASTATPSAPSGPSPAQAASYSDQPPPMRDWRALVHEIDLAHEPRLVVSSEYFAHADARVYPADRGRPRRRPAADRGDPAAPGDRIIPSMWQQNVQAGQRESLDRWLHRLFPEPPATSSSRFWKLHRHDDWSPAGPTSSGSTGSRPWWSTTATTRSSCGRSRACSACVRARSSSSTTGRSLADLERGRGRACLQRPVQGGRPGPRHSMLGSCASGRRSTSSGACRVRTSAHPAAGMVAAADRRRSAAEIDAAPRLGGTGDRRPRPAGAGCRPSPVAPAG